MKKRVIVICASVLATAAGVVTGLVIRHRRHAKAIAAPAENPTADAEVKAN